MEAQGEADHELASSKRIAAGTWFEVSPLMLRRQAWVLASVLVGAASLAGCGTFISDTTFINAPPRPMVARSPRSVRIFSAARPQRPFVDVATLAVKQTHQLNEEDDRLMAKSCANALRKWGATGWCWAEARNTAERAQIRC